MYLDLQATPSNLLHQAILDLADELCRTIEVKVTPMTTFKTMLMCDYSQELRRRGQSK